MLYTYGHDKIPPHYPFLMKPSSRRTSRRQSSRIVRKENIISRLLALPLDFLLSFNEDIETINWDSYSNSIAIPAGSGANLVLLLCRLAVDKSKPSFTTWVNKSNNGDEYNLFISDITANKRSGIGSLIYAITSAVGTILIITSVINAILVFFKTKRYSLFGRPIKNIPDTPSRVLVKIPIAAEPQESSAKTNGVSIFEGITHFIGASNAPNLSDDSKNYIDVWVLNIWEPSHFNLYLLSVFSPLNVFCLWFGPLSFFMLGIIVPATSGFLYLLIDKFVTQKKDRTIIHSEVLAEYEEQVVKPIVSVSKQDAMVGSDGSVDFYLPSLNNHYHSPTTISNRQREFKSHPEEDHNDQPFVESLSPRQQQGFPVFPSSINTANSIRRKSGMPQFQLHYSPAGYFTGKTPINTEESANLSESETYPSSSFQGKHISRLQQRIQQKTQKQHF